jgi:cyclic-di-GMP-binding protein
MPSFDIVSEIDHHELTNAVDQTNRELDTRFDFKGSQAKVTQEKEALLLDALSEFQLNQIIDILQQKMTRRGIDIQTIDPGKVEEGAGRARQRLKLRQGIDQELGKRIVKLMKESKIKVQASIQGEQVRVTGKQRDDLQQAIALLRKQELGQPLQFNNFRD